MKCPECGKFLANVVADVNGMDEVIKVTGKCRKHGEVQPTDWCWEDFFQQEAEQ